MPLRTVIVEDEAPSRERLKSLLEDIEDVDLVGEAEDGPDGVSLINTTKPDLALLDIQLPVFTSFELIERLTHMPHIIFITAYDEYAIKAFEANAVDYLLKPTTPERLVQAIERVKARAPQQTEVLIQKIQDALKKKNFRNRFTVRHGDEILLIPVEDVFWIHAEDKYLFLHTAHDNYLYEDTLKNLETCLDPDQFMRIHKSVIINLKKIHKIKRKLSGQYKVQMQDARFTAFEIGRTFLSNVRQKLDF